VTENRDQVARRTADAYARGFVDEFNWLNWEVLPLTKNERIEILCRKVQQLESQMRELQAKRKRKKWLPW